MYKVFRLFGLETPVVGETDAHENVGEVFRCDEEVIKHLRVVECQPVCLELIKLTAVFLLGKICAHIK